MKERKELFIFYHGLIYFSFQIQTNILSGLIYFNYQINTNILSGLNLFQLSDKYEHFIRNLFQLSDKYEHFIRA